ncbi:MAG: GNAT family N-acetyltransferase [Bdellovibrionales bacterium]|nr:GNAT family N-acetyltransferase [Bdellovibrionales bacterium]
MKHSFVTPRLTVRPFKKQDALQCEAFLSDPEVTKFIGDGNFKFEKTSSEKMVDWFMASCDSKTGLGTWAIALNNNGNIIGNCHLSLCEPVGKVEFGIAIAKTHWRQGYAAEVIPALLDYGHKKLGLGEIVCTVHHENSATKKGLEKLGYKFDRNIIHFGISQELYIKSS